MTPGVPAYAAAAAVVGSELTVPLVEGIHAFGGGDQPPARPRGSSVHARLLKCLTPAGGAVFRAARNNRRAAPAHPPRGGVAVPPIS